MSECPQQSVPEVMVEFREMAKEQAEAARAGDKEAQQKRVYYQGTLETDKANYWSPAFASRARGMPEILMALEPGHTLRLARGECRVAGRTIIASLVIGGRRKRAHDRAVDGNLLA